MSTYPKKRNFISALQEHLKITLINKWQYLGYKLFTIIKPFTAHLYIYLPEICLSGILKPCSQNESSSCSFFTITNSMSFSQEALANVCGLCMELTHSPGSA